MPVSEEHRREVLEEAELEVVDWYDVEPEFIAKWNQGEHVAITGRTGRGKTSLALRLLDQAAEQRDAYVCAMGTKRRDRTLDNTGWPVVRDWPPTYRQLVNHRIVIWPPYSAASSAKKTTGPALTRCLDGMMDEGGWRIFFDEMQYLVQSLSMRPVIDEFFNGARSSGISLVACSQRPVWVSRSGISQVEWAISFSISDVQDRIRQAEIMGDRNRFREVVGVLGPHEFVIVQTLTGDAVVTELPPKLAV